MMKGNRIRTALKGAERRRRGKKKALSFQILYCPYVESGRKELHVSKGH